MRKQFKKALSMVLSAAMVLTLGSGLEIKSAKAAQPDKACDAYIAFVDKEWEQLLFWGPGNKDNKNAEANEVKADGDGSYTLTLSNTATAAAVGTGFFAVEIKGLKKAMNDADAYEALKAENIKVTADGKEVAVDTSKIVCGNDNGNWRINFYNPWTSPATDALGEAATTLSWEKTLTVSFDLSGTGWGERTPEASEAPAGSATPGSSTTPGGTATPGGSSAPSSEPSSAPSGEPTEEPSKDPYIDEELWAKKGLHAYVSKRCFAPAE